jgi:hypothetical protein
LMSKPSSEGKPARRPDQGACLLCTTSTDIPDRNRGMRMRQDNIDSLIPDTCALSRRAGTAVHMSLHLQPTMRKSDAYLPPVSNDPARPCGLLGSPAPTSDLSERGGGRGRHRLRRRHMAMPACSVNSFFPSPSGFSHRVGNEKRNTHPPQFQAAVNPWRCNP